MINNIHKPQLTINNNIWLPLGEEKWPSKKTKGKTPADEHDDGPRNEIKKYCKGLIWNWPSKRIVFICDVHADRNALLNCLIAGDLIYYKNEKIGLTKNSEISTVIFGGDYFDKGPLNLPLIDTIKELKDLGLQLILLAGNHDIRTYTGFYYSECKDILVAHLFTRMGKKTIPLLKEIRDKYLSKNTKRASLSEKLIKEKLFPFESWYSDFAIQAVKHINNDKIKLEIKRIKQKIIEIDQKLVEIGMTYTELYDATNKAKELFIEKKGEYFWLFNEMKLIHKEGSFVFVHAGFDDKSAAILNLQGEGSINDEFKNLLSKNPFELYHGYLGNMFRTKYRPNDEQLTNIGAENLKKSGVIAIIHGHKNILKGHRLLVKKGVLNFECDVSVDINTRKLEGLSETGGGALVIENSGQILGISSDYPKKKVFEPSAFGSLIFFNQ